MQRVLLPGPDSDARVAQEFFDQEQDAFTRATVQANVNTGFLALDAATLGIVHPKSTTALPRPLHGVGPSKGIIEISPRTKSTRVFQQNIMQTSGSREFIFDSETNTFLLATKPNVRRGALSPHEVLADSIGKKISSKVVGGTLTSRNGIIQTGEFSGHFGENWTTRIRMKFKQFLESKNIKIDHSPYSN